MSLKLVPYQFDALQKICKIWLFASIFRLVCAISVSASAVLGSFRVSVKLCALCWLCRARARYQVTLADRNNEMFTEKPVSRTDETLQQTQRRETAIRSEPVHMNRWYVFILKKKLHNKTVKNKHSSTGVREKWQDCLQMHSNILQTKTLSPDFSIVSHGDVNTLWLLTVLFAIFS